MDMLITITTVMDIFKESNFEIDNDMIFLLQCPIFQSDTTSFSGVCQPFIVFSVDASLCRSALQ